jgi:hypothetical protein
MLADVRRDPAKIINRKCALKIKRESRIGQFTARQSEKSIARVTQLYLTSFIQTTPANEPLPSPSAIGVPSLPSSRRANCEECKAHALAEHGAIGVSARSRLH